MKTIRLTDGSTALVDDDNYALLGCFSWTHTPGYPRCNPASEIQSLDCAYQSKQSVSLHRRIFIPRKSTRGSSTRIPVRPLTLHGVSRALAGLAPAFFRLDHAQQWRTDTMANRC